MTPNTKTHRHSPVFVLLLSILIAGEACNAGSDKPGNQQSDRELRAAMELPDTLLQLTQEGSDLVLKDVCNCDPYQIVILSDTLLLSGECDVTTFRISARRLQGQDIGSFDLIGNDGRKQEIVFTHDKQKKGEFFVRIKGWASYDSLSYLDSRLKDTRRSVPADCDEW